ncbi:uncharacterized protein LOC122301581 [Carya illinoinensis]|uniref:uncharacterized protein LOC122301581 n=1 Tax=Carya illinoinensis TaxID=32201 RepID=UPI001C729006|nr:uncharacterized protein LOC122301581 [Carya illinoinensis]
MWRACLESLPTRVNLAKKQIVESSKCPICKSEEENVAHALWNCSSAMDVWSQTQSGLQKCSFRYANFRELVEALMSHYDQDSLEKFVIIARNIWHRRNQFVFENAFTHPNALVKKSRKTLEEYKVLQQKQMKQHGRNAQIQNRWQPPPIGVTKINWDASLNEDRGRAGFGLVARDHTCSILATKKLSKPCLMDPLLAESMGGLYAADMAYEMDCRLVILEGDSLTIVQGIEKQIDRWDRVGMILSDIKHRLVSLTSWRVSHVKRCGNVHAHNLAKEAVLSPGDVVESVDFSANLAHVNT